MWLVSYIMNDDYNDPTSAKKQTVQLRNHISPANSGSAPAVLRKKWKAAPISLADLVNDQLEVCGQTLD